MTLAEIRAMPTTMHETGPHPIHESLFRSYHIVRKVLELLIIKTPHDVIEEIIRDLDAGSLPRG